MPPPKSPSHRPGSSKRPSSQRSNSSSESTPTKLSTKGRHEVEATAGYAADLRSKGQMPESPSRRSSSLAGHERTPSSEHTLQERSDFEPIHMTGSAGSGIVTEPRCEVPFPGALAGGASGAAADGSPAGEVDRLREALNAQLLLAQQRDRLAKRLDEIGPSESTGPTAAIGRSRVSPIHEETMSPSLDAAFASPMPTGMETTSTESNGTLRGFYTPSVYHTPSAFHTPSAYPVRTPSYPFPSMKPPRQLSFNGHRPFTALSPTVAPHNFPGGSFETPHDRLLSGSVTPASTLIFQPGDNASSQSQGNPQFASPNLYELSLQLSAEPGLDAWWTTVVQILRDVFKADRVTLAVPADSTDIENVPWGQKATYNAVEEDEMSLSYLPRGSSLIPSSVDLNEDQYDGDTDQEEFHSPLAQGSDLRPGLATRHSFTAYEDTKRIPAPKSEAGRAAAASRRIPLSRSKSYISARPEQSPSPHLQNVPLNTQSLREHLEYENTKGAADWETSDAAAPRDVRGRMFTVLQALDYETDPLIDSSGILRVLERGNVIALTRDYPYIDNGPGDENSAGSKSLKPGSKGTDTPEKTKPNPPELARLSSFLGANKNIKPANRSVRISENEKGKTSISRPYDDLPPILSHRYEEYEQAPPSPWSQSPAPSPAVRTDTNENPFFVNATIDEDSFNPTTTPTDYSKIQEVETIGVDRSLSVLHIPLMHPLLSKPVQSFRLDNAAMEARSGHKYNKSNHLQENETEQEKRIPIAILSILSPIIPYPSTLRHGLQHLAPHLATSFSLCRHFTNLETEVAGLSRKRPHTSGFGAVVPGSHHTDLRTRYGNLHDLPGDDDERNQSTGGSITSPSDYSGISRSNAGSPAVTPGWDPSSVGLTMDRRTGSSPGYTSGDNYFSPRPRVQAPREPAQPGVSSIRRSSQESSETHIADLKQQRATFEEKRSADSVSTTASNERPEIKPKIPSPGEKASLASTSAPRPDLARVKSERNPRDTTSTTSEQRDSSPSRAHNDTPLSPRRQAMRGASSQTVTRTDRPHTQLHSYGADFSSTFQSLPTTTAVNVPGTPRPVGPPRGHIRVGSNSQPIDMPPPSDRLKGLMLDSLPAHVFVALPHTGEIVWVNSRYLTYRGQTVSELYQDPWSSIHPEERDDYLKAWTHALRTGEQFSKQVRIKRFDGSYRWFYTRAVGSRDTRGVLVQWYGSHMDIHEQHIAEVKAARQEEIEASEAKHRLLANLIPQIMFAATEDEGITFANEQWLSYTGQNFDDALGLGFMDHVHPDDLAKCRIPTDRPPTPMRRQKPSEPSRQPSQTSSAGKSSSNSTQTSISDTPTETTVKGVHHTLSRQNSSSSDSKYDLPSADLSELARNGIVKVATDSNGRLSYTTEVRLRSKHNEYRWHLVRCVEVDNINFGSGDGSWFGACTDINDHKLLETKLKEAMESKSKFLSNMSHEIRTPLIGISGMVSFLQDTVLNEEQLDYTNTIQTSANGLLMIINDILDLSKVDAGMMKLSYEWFHTRSLIEDVNELVSTMAISKRLELNYVVDEDVPAMVKGDKVRIRQVLLNVIGNAIKFTSEGEVFSRCRVHHGGHVGENEIMLEYSIVDTGRGFTKEEGELIFKPFSQIDGSSTRQHGGSGLGLVISRQLVELHGGQMEGSAVPGKGSTFTFTSRFGLPTDVDHPEPPPTPSLTSKPSSATPSFSHDTSARALKQAGGNPILANKFIASPSTMSPPTDPSSSPAIASSASSDPSIRSSRTHMTDRSSVSSIKSGLAHFSEAARRSSADLSSMRLELPDRNSTNTTPKQNPVLAREDSGSSVGDGMKHFRPPMYSILVICPQTHSREATTQHIEMTLPKDVPHQITALASVVESQKMIGGGDPVVFTHIVLNLSSAEEIIALMDQIFGAIQLPQTSIVILSDPVQRQAVMKLASEYDYEQLAKDNRVSFVYKPVKPSRFAVIFDPDKERDLSTDRNRSSAQQQVATQKQNYLDAEKRLGNKGHKVLLVEDNLVNQKVLLKYLSKVGISVDMALDGMECTEKVFSNPPGFYSLILCDLHMPRKDGYQTCREIREHERSNNQLRMPIIALSANVMADVLDKCVAAGFNSYVTKPVDFKALSTAMSNLLDPDDKSKEADLMKR